jgi:hypothetical protein
MLAVGIVNVNHGVVKQTLRLARLEAVNTRGGLLAAANETRAKSALLTVNKLCEVAAVVNHKVGHAGKRVHKVLFVLLVRNAVARVYVNPHSRESRRNVVLRRKRVAARGVHLSSARAKSFGKASRLCLKVN